MAKFWDDDIAKLKLTDEEKNGLQVFRSYSGAFEEHRCKTFSAQVDSQAFPLEPLTRVVALIKEEDPRFLPVIASSFIDEHLKEMFHRDIPENIPGGRAGLLNGFGPLSRLSQKLQIAYAFGWLSEDLILDADKLRKIRNDISHKWDLAELSSKLDELVDQHLSPIEDHLEDEKNFSRDFFKDLGKL